MHKQSNLSRKKGKQSSEKHSGFDELFFSQCIFYDKKTWVTRNYTPN